MLMPRKVKHRKHHRGRTAGMSKGGNELAFGEYGIQALEPGWLTARQIERHALGIQINKLKAENGPLREIQKLESNPAWRDIGVERMVEAWTQERDDILRSLRRPVGFQSGQAGGWNQGLVNTLALVFSLMVGSAALPHILVRSYTTETPKEAKQSIAWALFFVVLVYLCASSLAVLISS